MAFRILITETKEEVGLTARAWTQVDTVLCPEDPSKFKAKFDYTPQVEQRQMVEVKRLEQVVDGLDLPAVIRAINGL